MSPQSLIGSQSDSESVTVSTGPVGGRDFPELAIPLDNSPTRPGTLPRDQPPPQRDPACIKCTTPVTQGHKAALKPNGFAYGEIVKIKESVHAPIESIFTTLGQPVAATPSRSLSQSRGKQRPGVFLSVPRNPRAKVRTWSGTKVRLMATFGGIHELEGLPRVLRHFCMPVSPHFGVGVGVEHLHTTPEWQKDHTRLILHPCVSSGTLSGRWEWRDEGGTSPGEFSFKLDELALSEVEDISKRRFEQWNANCLADPGYRGEYLQEYWVSYEAYTVPYNISRRAFLYVCKRWKDSNNESKSIGGSPLVLQATSELPATTEQDGYRGIEQAVQAPGPSMLSSSSLSNNADVGSGPSIPSPSHSRHTSTCGGSMSMDASLPVADPNAANRLGISFGPENESRSSALRPLPLDVPGESFGPPEASNGTSATSIESLRDDAVPEDTVTKQPEAALEDGRTALPHLGASIGVNVEGSLVDNNQTNRGDLLMPTAAQPAALPSARARNEDSKGP